MASSLILTIHSQTPEHRKIVKVVEALRDGAVIVYPTDTSFSLGCALSNKDAIHRIRTIRRMPPEKSLTFLCDSLSNLSEFAKVNNAAYRVINGLIPGPYTFILPASKNVPKFAQNPKRKTAGIRVPDNRLCRALLSELGSPIISITAKRGDEPYNENPESMAEDFSKIVDIIVESDTYNFNGDSSIIDMTGEKFMIKRKGAGFGKVKEFLDIEE